jgi:hypothetical protein
MKCVKAEEIFLATENKVGKLEEVCNSIKEKGINIRAICAYALEDKAFFRLITSDNTTTKEVLSNLGEVESREVIIVELPDEVGMLQQLALRLKQENIDLNYIYGTTSQPHKEAIIVFSSNNNEKALEVISNWS